MISVFIDTMQISSSFNMDENEVSQMVDYTIKEITARFASEWENEANRTLKSSRQEYIANLNVVDEGFAKGAVVLTGVVPNMIESGADGFDMKEGLLNGPNARITKSGNRLNIVPFTFGAPDSLGENFSNILPKEVHNIVKQRNVNEPLEKYDLKGLPQQFREPQKKTVKLPKSESFAEYQHKSSIYEGVRKVKDSVTGQNSYKSFRAVSDASDANSWIHPGIDAANLADKVLSNFDIPEETGRAIDRFLS